MTGVSKAWVWAREGGGKIIKVDRSCVRPAGSLKRAAAAAALAGPYRSADDIRDISEIGEIVVSWIDGKHNEADALTKALPEPRFRELTAMFRGRQPRMLRALMAGLRRLGWSRSMAVP